VKTETTFPLESTTAFFARILVVAVGRSLCNIKNKTFSANNTGINRDNSKQKKIESFSVPIILPEVSSEDDEFSLVSVRLSSLVLP